MYRYLLLLLVSSFLCHYTGRAQTSIIAGLKKQITVTQNPDQKLALLFDLCEERPSLSTDTLFYYASLAKIIAQQKRDEKQVTLADYYILSSLARKVLADSNIRFIDEHLAKLRQSKNSDDLFNKYAYLKVQLLIQANQYKEAIALNYQVLERAEKNKDTLSQIRSRNGIGWAYMEMDQNREAINWFYKALNVTKDKSYFEKYTVLLPNLAATYNTIGKNDSAEYFVKQSLYYARKRQNLQTIANSLAIQADIFIDTKRSSLAEAPLAEALEIRKHIGDPFYIISDMTQLAIYYAHNNQTAKGIALCQEGIRMANQYNLSSKLSILYTALAENYKAENDYKSYGEVLQKLLAVKDSVYQLSSADALAQLQTKYDLQKKETIITQQQLDISQQNLDLVRKNYWLYGSIIVSFLTVTSLFLFFKNYRRKQQLKLHLMREEEVRKSERAVMLAEEAERKRIAADLHDSLGAYAASIASNIQQLESSLHIKNSTVLQELKANSQAIVSQLSDTIWVLKKDALLLTSISDRAKVFIQKLGPNYPSVTIDVSESIATDYLLPPAQAFHLFQIIKEGLINALKHSRCTHITVKIDARDGWRVSITDNGKGMAMETLLAEAGNGLTNMKERSKESGWKIVWQRNEPNGTSVVIEPTTN